MTVPQVKRTEQIAVQNGQQHCGRQQGLSAKGLQGNSVPTPWWILHYPNTSVVGTVAIE